MGAVISRANTAADKGDTSEIAIAAAWCNESHHNITKILNDMCSSDVEKSDKATLAIGKASLDEGGYFPKSPVGC